MATAAAQPPTKTGTNPPHELGRYADRVIVGQRIDGVVELRDEPDGQGLIWPIDRGFACMEELETVVRDYIAKAHDLGGIPMAGFAL